MIKRSCFSLRACSESDRPILCSDSVRQSTLNFTWFVMSRLDTTRHVQRVYSLCILAVSSLSNSTARPVHGVARQQGLGSKSRNPPAGSSGGAPWGFGGKAPEAEEKSAMYVL